MISKYVMFSVLEVVRGINVFIILQISENGLWKYEDKEAKTLRGACRA